MKSFTKLPLALSLALFGAASSISALAMATEPTHEVHEIKEVMVEINGDENVNITVEINGEVTDLVLPKSVLHDKEALADALSDVPDAVREELLTSLGNVHISDKMIKVHQLEGLGDGDMNWSSNDGERIVVIEANSESEHHDVDINQMINKMKHRMGGENTFVIKHTGKIDADMVLRLIKDADLSADDLDKIQQALDAKR